jgi:hypothetical protein
MTLPKTAKICSQDNAGIGRSRMQRLVQTLANPLYYRLMLAAPCQIGGCPMHTYMISGASQCNISVDAVTQVDSRVVATQKHTLATREGKGMRAHMLPHFAGEDGGGAVESNKRNPHADPAGHLVAESVAHASCQQEEEHCQREEERLQGAVDAQGLQRDTANYNPRLMCRVCQGNGKESKKMLLSLRQGCQHKVVKRTW